MSATTSPCGTGRAMPCPGSPPSLWRPGGAGALCSGLVVACRSAASGLAVGLLPDGGGAWLPADAPPARSAWRYSGRQVSAASAEAIGLILALPADAGFDLTVADMAASWPPCRQGAASATRAPSTLPAYGFAKSLGA